MNKFYITTTLPYINADPHIGFAMEIIQADVLARYRRALGDEVFFNTGTDEHGMKVYQRSQESGIDIQKYCDEKAEIWKKLKEILNLRYDNFIRTTDEKHIKAAQEFWKRCEKNGDIYKKKYKIKYCVGCELEKTESELENGCCPLHPNWEVEIIDEENYFFRFSKYKEKLLELYKNNPDFVKPRKRFNEIIKFIERGPEDFSISRLKEKLPWGVLVPNDDKQVIYVWFDALVNYISAIGWPDDLKKFNKWWPAVQLAGKDNLRQQSAMWQAMLMSAGLPPSKQIFINGFVNVGGKKMSKSLGNVIAPPEMIEKFGVDGTRYLLLSMGGNFGEDTDVTWGKMAEKYNADLANGLGNLVSRVVKLSQFMTSDVNTKIIGENYTHINYSKDFIEKLELSQLLSHIWYKIADSNKYIEDGKPWMIYKKNKDHFDHIMNTLFYRLYEISYFLDFFLPDTAIEIRTALDNKKTEILFPRVK
jgi:methionyl-tRNA synthetase